MSIEMIKIRAIITIGSFSVSTPFILSFNVRKTRGQISTFDASLKVEAGTSIPTGDQVKIFAGTEGNEKLIFSGVVKKATISPCWDDPQYVMMNIGGEDVLGLLTGKKFTRRCKASRSAWVSIDSVVRKGLKSGKFTYKVDDILFLADAELDESTALTKAMALTDLGPWNKIKHASSDRKLEKIDLETGVYIE